MTEASLSEIATPPASATIRPNIDSLVDDHYESVFRYLRQTTRDPEAAEDLTQQTFLKAHRKLGSFRQDASARTWLFAIAFREFTTWRRRQRIIAAWKPERTPTRDPFSTVDDGEWLLEGLRSLPEEYRHALLLHEVQGFSVEEIAEVTLAPIGTVKSRLHHARKKLRETLESGEDQ